MLKQVIKVDFQPSNSSKRALPIPGMEGRCPQRPNLRNTKHFDNMVSIVRSPGTAPLQQWLCKK